MTDVCPPFALHLPNEALEDLLKRLETGSLSGTGLLILKAQVAWHLRQRDCQRSLGLAADVAGALADAHLDDTQRQRIAARLMLIRSEIDWLCMNLDSSQDLAQQALTLFEQAGDLCGQGDTLSQLAALHMEQGRFADRDSTLQRATTLYEQAGDATRARVAQARSFHYNAFEYADVTAARIRLFEQGSENEPPEVLAWLRSAQGIVASQQGHFSAAITHFLQAYDSAKATGQIRNAIGPASNVADTFARLGDLESALEWNNHALELARLNGWPGITSLALSQTGNVLRLLGRQEEARQALNESLGLMDQAQRGTIYALTLQYLGDLALDGRQYAEALQQFNLAERRARELNSPVILQACLKGSALALVRLGRVAEARLRLDKAMQLAQGFGNLDAEIELLRIHAELHDRVVLPPPEGMTAATPRLHFLHRALELSKTRDDPIEPAELHDELGQAYASLGDFERAYEHAMQAARARTQSQLEEGRTRAKAIQLRQELTRAMAEAEQLRSAARLETERAQALERSNDILTHLAEMGRSITLHLNHEALFECLFEHASKMLPMDFLGIYLLDEQRERLNWAYGREAGRPVQGPPLQLDDPEAGFAMCARERREIHVRARGIYSHPAIGESLDTQSLMFFPLLADGNLLGAISVQSVDPDAYGEREQTLFRALSQYAAIALDQARTHAKVNASDQDHHGFLSRVGHEIRTPMNGILGLLRLLQDTPLNPRQQDFVGKTSDSARALLEFLNDVLDYARLGSNALHLSDQSFSLDEVLKALAQDMGPVIARTHGDSESPAELVFDVEPTLPPTLRGDALRLRQVLFSLCSHALKSSPSGEVSLKIRGLSQDQEVIALSFSVQDQAPPLPAQAQAQLFSPFSEWLGHRSGRAGDTGLSLGIAERLVRLMGGSLQCQPGSHHGNTLSFQLVLDKAEADALPEIDAAEALPGLDVLIVDDRDASRQAMLKMASTLSWQAEAADNGPQALQKMQERLRSGRDPYSAVFIDADMPGLDGWDTLARMRQLHDNCPMPLTVLLSSASREQLEARSLQEQDGLNGILAKPITSAMMLDIVRRAFTGQRNLRSRQRNRIEQTRPLLGMSVLVAEDQPINLEVTQEMLVAAGAQVTIVQQGQEVIELLRQRPQGWSLILMDLDMPVMNGQDCARAIRGELKLRHLPLLAMTAHVDTISRDSLAASGFNELLHKPFEPEALVSSVLRLTGLPAAVTEQAAPADTPTIDWDAPAIEIDVPPAIDPPTMPGELDEPTHSTGGRHPAPAPLPELPEVMASQPSAAEPLMPSTPSVEPMPAPLATPIPGDMQLAAAELGLDLQSVLQRYRGKPGLYDRMVFAFVKSASCAPGDLDHCLLSGRLAEAALNLHKLKRAADMLGASKLAHKLGQGELLLLRGDAPNAAWRQQFAQELMLAIQQLRQITAGLVALASGGESRP